MKNKVPTELQRLTTRYHVDEDRIYISGLLPDDKTVQLWLTQRLLTKFLPHMFGWLEKQTRQRAKESFGIEVADMVQGFAQQSATAAHQPASPVVPQPGKTVSCLIHSLDVAMSDNGIRIIFQVKRRNGQANEMARIGFSPMMLRQWLNILHSLWRQGGWSMTVWPDWMADRVAPEEASQQVMLH